MLIDVFELAEVKLTLLEQLHDLLDATERYWLDQASLSHREDRCSAKQRHWYGSNFCLAVRPDPRQKKEGHDQYDAGTTRVTKSWSEHDTRDGLSRYVGSSHQMDHSGHDMSGSSHQIEHEAHGKDRSEHGMPRGWTH